MPLADAAVAGNNLQDTKKLQCSALFFYHSTSVFASSKNYLIFSTAIPSMLERTCIEPEIPLTSTKCAIMRYCKQISSSFVLPALVYLINTGVESVDENHKLQLPVCNTHKGKAFCSFYHIMHFLNHGGLVKMPFNALH